MTVESIVKAIADNDVAAFTRALDMGVPVETRVTAHWNETLLGYACFNLREEMVRELLQRGADPNAADKDGYSPLRLLIFSSNDDSDIIPAIRLLINAGADPSQKTNDGGNCFNSFGMKGPGYPKNAVLEALKRPPDNEKLNNDPLQVIFNRQVGNKDIEEIYLFDTLERVSLLHPRNSNAVEAMARESFAALSQKSLLRDAFDEHVRRGGTVSETEVFGMTNFSFGFEKKRG